MKFRLPDEIYSIDQIGLLRLELIDWSQTQKQLQVKSRVGLKIAAEDSRSVELKELIRAWEQAGHRQDWSLLESELQRLIKTTPVVKLTLAAPPNRELKQRIVNWLRAEVRSELFISFNVDREMGGGITIRTPSRIYDYSFRQQLLAKKNLIPGLVKNV